MGAKFSTEQRFGGQKASVGRVVVICCPRHDEKPGTCLRAGMIVAVSSTKDLPWIVDVKHPSDPTLMMKFHPTLTPEDAEAMPVDTWTWPPRV